MRMRQGRDQRGGGAIKTVIILVVVLYGIIAAAKLIPAWSDDKAIQKKAEEVLKFAGTNRYNIDDMVFHIAEEAEKLKIPIGEEDIEVTDEGNRYRAKFSYVREVKLPGYTYKKPVNVDVSWTKY